MNFRSTLKKRIIAAITSVAMAGTFIPELAAPVLAEEVRKEILNADIAVSDNTTGSSDPFAGLDPDSDEYAQIKAQYAGGAVPSKRRMLKSASLNNNVLSNEYIELYAAGGKFSIGTTGGDPERTSDDNKILVYGHRGGGTSFTTVRVNGESYVYGASDAHFDEENSSNISSNIYNGVKVEALYSIKENSATGRDETVLQLVFNS